MKQVSEIHRKSDVGAKFGASRLKPYTISTRLWEAYRATRLVHQVRDQDSPLLVFQPAQNRRRPSQTYPKMQLNIAEYPSFCIRGQRASAGRGGSYGFLSTRQVTVGFSFQGYECKICGYPTGIDRRMGASKAI